MQDLNNKVTGDSLTASEWDEVPSEIQNVIETAGIVLSGGDLSQQAKGVAVYVAGADFYTATGSNAITLAPIGLKKTPPTLFVGMRARFVAVSNSTGNVTINVASTGVKSVLLETGAQLPSGSFVTGFEYEVYYDGTQFKVKQQLLGGAITNTSTVSNGFISGYSLSNNVATPASVIDIAVGTTKSADNTLDMTLATALGKSIALPWADGGTVGAPTGGMANTVTLTNNTWYRVMGLVKPSGTVNVGFTSVADASGAVLLATPAVVSAGYTKVRRIGWVYYGTATILQFTQVGSIFTLNAGQEFSTATPNTTKQTLTALAPPTTLSGAGILAGKIMATISARLTPVTGASVAYGNIYDQTTTADLVPTSTNCNVNTRGGGGDNDSQIWNGNVGVTTSSQFAMRFTTTLNSASWVSTGWIDNRGM